MLLLLNADVYAPEHLGKRDILVEANKIAKVEEDLSRFAAVADTVIDMQGKQVVPGYIDSHVHLTGGGGEQGPASRCPQCPLTELTRYGVTSVLGLLGTDGTSRSLENLLFKTLALNEEGVTAWMETGSYQYPSPTLTGTVMKDLALIESCQGCKIAISDHRCSNPTAEELARLACDVRMGGMVGGKASVVTLHVGKGKKCIQNIFDALEMSDLPANVFWPTHMASNMAKLKEGVKLIEMGGTIDVSATDTPHEGVAVKLSELYRLGVDMTRITMSSDAFGSLPRFDETGRCIGMRYTSTSVLHQELTAMVQDYGIPLETALLLLTKNPARMLKKEGIKGCIAPGADADLIVYGDGMIIEDVYAKGRLMVKAGEPVVKGYFEE